MARRRLVLNPITGLFDWIDPAPPDYVQSVADTSTVDLNVDINGVLTATVIPAGIDHGALAGLTDDDHLQYHTDARALTWLNTRSTTDLPEGSRLYWTQGRFDTAFAVKSTTDLAEGTNLYWTAERTDDQVAILIDNGVGLTWTYDDTLGSLVGDVSLSPFDTDDLAEGATNLYFTQARARLSLSINPGAPIFYNNVTGVFDLGVVPISYGGTGSSNVQAAINGLTNSALTAAEGDHFQWLGGNAQFAPYVAPGTTGSPFAMARYDSLGDLVASNYWSMYDDGQVSGGSTFFTNNANALRLGSDVQAAVTVSDPNLIQGSLNNLGTMNGFVSLLNLSFSDGSGLGTTDFVNGLNIGLQNNTVNNKQYANFYSSGTVGGGLSGIYVDSDDDVTGFVSLMSIRRSGLSLQGLNGYEVFLPSGADVTGGVNMYTATLSSSIGDYSNGVNFNIDGSLTKGFNFLNLNVSGSIGDGTGTPLTGLNMFVQNTATINGDVQGLALYNAANLLGNSQVIGGNTNNQGTAYRYIGFTSSNNANMSEEIRGFQHNSTGDARTQTGLDIYMAGNATDDATGFRMNVTNLTSSTQRPKSFDISGHTWNINSVYTPAAGLFVDTGNNAFTEFRVASGSPITGTDMFTNNNIVAFLVQDDVALGPIGLGANHTSFVSLLGVADTKTVDQLSNIIFAGSAQSPGYPDAGTITLFKGLDYVGVLPGGGNTVVTNAYGLHMRPGFDGYAANNWGLRVEGTTANNYLNSLAVGTASFTATSGYLVDINGKVLLADDLDTSGNVRITAPGKGLAVAEGADAKLGTATLVAGTVTVNTTVVTANSRIFLTNQAAGGTVGSHSIANLVPGTSFDIISTDPGDTSVLAWLIIEGI